MARWPLERAVIDVEEVLKHLHFDCYLSKRSAAAYLDWSLRTLDFYLSEIPHFKLHGRVYFKRSTLDRYMADFRVEGAPSEEIRLRALADETLAKMEGA